uniref:GMC_oxred_C domain-containing protein n=1 Tax=Macrostomum lignano TaxID=282301 RepID=A0A1I8FIE1_9PLAT
KWKTAASAMDFVVAKRKRFDAKRQQQSGMTMAIRPQFTKPVYCNRDIKNIKYLPDQGGLDQNWAISALPKVLGSDEMAETVPGHAPYYIALLGANTESKEPEARPSASEDSNNKLFSERRTDAVACARTSNQQQSRLARPSSAGTDTTPVVTPTVRMRFHYHGCLGVPREQLEEETGDSDQALEACARPFLSQPGGETSSLRRCPCAGGDAPIGGVRLGCASWPAGAVNGEDNYDTARQPCQACHVRLNAETNVRPRCHLVADNLQPALATASMIAERVLEQRTVRRGGVRTQAGRVRHHRRREAPARPWMIVLRCSR